MASNPGIQPQGATNNGNLFIPNKANMKAFDSTKYGTDMRAIERWCNSLIAGGGEPEVVIFQMEYTSTGCGPAFVPASMGKIGSFNLTFTVPTSGQVKVKIESMALWTAAAPTDTAGIVLCCVDTATGTVQESPFEIVGFSQAGSQTTPETHGGRVTYEALVAGLTAGATENWSIGGYYLTGSATSAQLQASPGTSTSAPAGPILVTVYAA